MKPVLQVTVQQSNIRMQLPLSRRKVSPTLRVHHGRAALSFTRKSSFHLTRIDETSHTRTSKRYHKQNDLHQRHRRNRRYEAYV
jgi:hypothetical protein